MIHDLLREGFVLNRAVHAPSQHLAQVRLPVNDAVAELLLQRQRHQAVILTLAHELRQPLAVMVSATRILQDARSSTALPGAVEIIDRQARRMTRLIDDLVESTQSAQGTMLLRTRRLDLRAEIAEALSDVAEAIAARGHHLVIPDGAEPLWVDADAARLRQVLSNLLDNAIKFTEPGGRIELTACRVRGEIVLRVSDTGRGLRPQELAHIFDPFFQVRPAEAGGLGIGLTVVSQIVALHKGRIDVRSDGPSRGSEFTLTLPSAAHKMS